MKTLWLLPLGLVVSCWYCGATWAQNKIEVNPSGQTKIESNQADPSEPQPANATPNRKIINPGTPGDPGSETSTFSAVNNNITTILQDYQELTGKTVIEDSNLSANAVPITILVPNPVPREQLVRLIEAALLLNNYAFVPGPSENTVKVINLNTGKNPRSEWVRLYTTPDSLPEGEQIVKTDPPRITITGPKHQVEKIEAATTDPIDATGAHGNAVFMTNSYVADPLVQVVQTTSMSVIVTVDKAGNGSAH